MKRLNSDERIAWMCLCKKREKKRLKKLRGLRKRKLPRTKITFINIQAPRIFELNNSSHRELIKFIAKINAKISQKKHVKIDFSQTKSMVVCGTLRFFAELNRIEKDLGLLSLISCNCPKNETVAQVLQHLGILKMLGCRCSTKPERDDVVNWKIASGENTNATEVGQILESQSNLPEAKSKKLYRGVSEAMTNVSQHAYLNQAKTVNKGWWMFYREENDRIFVAFCDLGVGIPITLPETIEKNKEVGVFMNVVNRLFPNKLSYSDGELIRAAIEVKRSRTRQTHRGKGFLDMIKVIDNSKNGRLTIFSNKGAYSYELHNSTGSEKTLNYKESIDGTLIIWSLPLCNIEK